MGLKSVSFPSVGLVVACRSENVRWRKRRSACKAGCLKRVRGGALRALTEACTVSNCQWCGGTSLVAHISTSKLDERFKLCSSSLQQPEHPISPPSQAV